MGFKHNDKCLEKAGDDEPIFVLRSTDKLAPRVVRHWAWHAEAVGAPAEKVAEARGLADLMEAWQRENYSKFPD